MQVELAGIHIQGPDPVGPSAVPVQPGGVTALYGVNGAGKSRVLAGLDATVRTIRPARSYNCTGAIVFRVLPTDDETVDNTYARPLVDHARRELENLHRHLAGVRGSPRPMPAEWPALLRELVELTLLENVELTAPEEIAALAHATADDPAVAVRVRKDADDEVEPGDSRPLSFVPAVPGEAAAATSDVDPSHPAVDSTALANLQHHLGDRVPQIPVPVDPPGAATVRLDADDLGLLPPVVRLYEEDVLSPTLAVLYGEPTLREQLGRPHRPLIDIADTETFALTGDVANSAQRLQDEANAIYARLLEDPPPLRLHIRHPNEWARLPAVRWEAEVSARPPNPADLPPPGKALTGGRWLSIDELSTGQRRWASFAIRVACLLADPADGPHGAAAVLDEPEQALHRQAERYCAAGLRALAEELGLAVVVATHSPEVLDAPEAIPLHVTRDAAARSHVRAFSGWLTTDKTTLGLARSDLVLRYRTFLLVEGQHDEAALRTWAADELEDARTRILVLGGSDNLPPMAASQLLFDMTEAQVVVLLDGVDTDKFLEKWHTILADWQADPAARSHAGKRLADLIAQPGEIGQLAQFCRHALEHGHEHRIHPFGLAEPDIANYMSVQAFAPNRPEGWAQLKAQAQQTLGRNFNGAAFKEWLRDHRDIKINAVTVEKAARETDRPAEIDAVVEQCRSLAHRRSQ